LLGSFAAAAPVLMLVTPAQAATTTVAQWPMTGDPMTDTSGHGNTGTLTDVTVLPGGGYQFAASDSHVTVPDNDSLDPGTNTISYTVHLQLAAPPAAGTDYDVIRKGLAGTSGGEWKMEVLPNSTTGAANPFCLFKDNAGHTDSIRGSQNLADGGWHTVTCVRTTSTNQLIVDNGQPKTSTPSAPLTGSISNSAPVVIGQKLGGGDQYDGAMRDVTVQIGSDTTAPTVTSTNPASGASSVATSTSVTATFNEAVQNVGNSTFTLKDAAGTLVPANVTYDSATNTATLQPSAALAPGTGYTATLTNGITDANGTALATTSWSFTTAGSTDTTPPTVTAKSPAAGATTVATSTAVTATFSEPVQLVSGLTMKLKLAGTTTVVPSTVTYDSATMTATLQPNAALSAGTKYTVTLTSGIKDLAGNALKSTSWSFTTAGGTGTGTAPTVKSGTPAGNATSVGLATNVTATFSQAVQNVNGSTFTLTPDGGSPVAAAYTANSTGTKWTLNPNVNLAKDTWYTVNLTTGITSTTNTALAAPVSWRFLTGPAPTVSSKTPANGATSVSTTTTVTATFNEPVLNVTGTTFTLQSASGPVTATVTRSGTTNKYILTPSAPLQSGTLYTATVIGGSSGVTDLAGNPLKTVTWTFTTA
jgi:methionine-rich copper-binding protein CopC